MDSIVIIEEILLELHDINRLRQRILPNGKFASDKEAIRLYADIEQRLYDVEDKIEELKNLLLGIKDKEN
ncbi:MAG: hypothetical protein ACOCUV_00725 [bacterium]